ncbi:Tyrosinase [Dactylellina cionopaga]|nr:Tyrosinase [Dactylellina cionopaga]
MGDTVYNSFSSDLESIHNDVHSEIGGNGGHMSYLTYSAFDPIFWLHHNNIDRLLAIWQAANPGQVLKSANGVVTFARPNPGQDTITTPLYPFTRADGSSWISTDVSTAGSIWNFNYGFPEVPCSAKTYSATQLDSFATTQINNLYNTRTRSTKRDADQTVLEWNINAVVDQSELPGGFSINFFLGKVPGDPSDWSSQKIGALTILGGIGMTMPSQLIPVTIPINQALGDKLSESEADIDTYLEQNLVWGCLNNGEIVDITKLSTLTVGVTNNPVTFSSSTKNGREDNIPGRFSDIQS